MHEVLEASAVREQAMRQLLPYRNPCSTPVALQKDVRSFRSAVVRP
jgi:hypothetical protein